MYFILKGNDDSKFYLLPNNTYLVGRKDCDIIILKSDSISRKHATLVVTNDVAITDTNSRYGTFVNETKLKSNNSVTLKDGDTVKFGFKSIYKFQIVTIINTTSGIKSEHKLKIKDNMNVLGGLLVQNWTEQCNYVTVEELMLTVKVLSAIIVGIPIVTLKYWDDYIMCVKSGKPLPDTLKYAPKCCEVVLNENISIEYKEERKEVFKNKVFVFSQKNDMDKMASLIKLAGGTSLYWDADGVDIDKIKKESLEYVLMQTSDLNDTIKQKKSFSNFLDYYIKMGNRTIPLQEIALAIINCSCEKDCNPKFNRKACVFKTSTQKIEGSEHFLAMATQTVDINSSPIDIKNEIIIPQSFDVDMNIDISSKIEIDSTFQNQTDKPKITEEVQIKTQDSSASLKRESDSNHSECIPKRIKVQENLTPLTEEKEFSRSTSIGDTKQDINPIPTSAKSLFAFKHTNIASEKPTMVVNPFSKKRKAEMDESVNTSKKQSVENDMPTTSSKSNTKLAINPFSNMFKSKSLTQKESLDVSKVTSTLKNKSSEKTKTKDVNSLEIDISEIPVIDESLEKSFQWITKSQTKSYSTEIEDEKVDQDLLVFINSFRDAVVVEEESDMVVRKPVICPTRNLCNGDMKNYKKFKKVQPLKKQMNIIPATSYVSIICNDTNEHEYNPEELEDGIEDLDSQTMQERQRGRQYVF